MKGKKAKAVEIDFNPEFQHALTLMEDRPKKYFYHRPGGYGQINAAELFP
jgi:hypothetical protein